MSDPKIRRLNPIHQLMWVYLLCHASDACDITSDAVCHIRILDETDLVTAVGIMPQDDVFELTKGFFDKCVKLEMIELSETGVMLKTS